MQWYYISVPAWEATTSLGKVRAPAQQVGPTYADFGTILNSAKLWSHLTQGVQIFQWMGNGWSNIPFYL